MYQRRTMTVLLVIILLYSHNLLPSSADSSTQGTQVGGRLRKNNVWSKENSPYILVDDLTIPPDISLTITEGVTVDLSLWSITVEGEFKAVGTLNEKVRINITLAPFKESKKGRIYFTPASLPYWDTYHGCKLQNVVISCSDYSITYGVLQGGKPLIDNVEIYGGLSHYKEYAVKTNGTVTNCLFDGVYMAVLMGDGTITDNTFLNTRHGTVIDIYNGLVKDNVINGGKRAIRVQNASIVDNTIMNMELVGINIQNDETPSLHGKLKPRVAENVIVNCGEAIKIWGDVRPVVTNNLILEDSHGISFETNAFYGGAKPRIENNAFYDNDFNVYMYREDPRITVSMPNNWWGTIDHEIIEDKIYDVNDNPRLCSVEYTPILSEPPFYLPKVPYRLELSSLRSSVKLGENIELSGIIVPPLKVLNVQVVCVGPDGSRRENALSTDSKGAFSYIFTPGSIGIWSITVASEGSLLTDSGFKSIQVEVTKIDSQIELNYEPKPCFEDGLVTINGVLTPSKPNEVIGFVVIHPDGSEYNGYTTTESGGVFTYETYGAQSGIYTATFTWPGTDEYAGSAETISYRVQSPSGLKIIVEDEDGEKIVSAGIKSTAQPDDQGTLTGVTDSGGSILFTEIAAGDYTFTVEKSGYEPRTLTLSLPEGETQEIKTMLSETKTIPASYTPPAGEEEPSPKNDPLIWGFIPSILTFGILITLYILVRKRALR
jgi:hypothetical protein